MATQYDQATQEANIAAVLTLLTELKSDLNNLRTDFLAHDHGNTGSYVQQSITLRATANSMVGTAAVNTAVAADLPISPIIADNFLNF